MQLKETEAGEVTVWLAEMSITIGGTDEVEAAQRKEREGTNNNTCNRYPAIPTVALSYLPTLCGFQMGVTTSGQCQQGRQVSSQNSWGPVYFRRVHLVVFSHSSLHFHTMTHTAQ